MKDTKNRIYLAYSGLGKTTYCQTHAGCMDVDKGGFKGNISALVNFAAFCLKKGYLVLVSARIDIIKEFERKGLPINIIVPSEDRKAEILETVKKRDNIPYYYHLLKHYDEEIEQIKSFKNFDSFVELKPGEYIDSILDK